MSKNNQVVLIGTVQGKTPMHALSKEGPIEIKFNLEVTTNQITETIPCKFWNRQADTVEKYIENGQYLSVTGSLRFDKNDTGLNAWINGENFQLLRAQ
jgi:primosomal replication protein N